MAAVDFRYARALSAVVADQNLDTVGIQAQLNDFVSTLDSSAELREVLENPSIPEQQKLGLLDALASRMMLGKVVRNFIAVVARHQRLHELREMVSDYSALTDEAAHIAEAEVVSAQPLSEASRKLLEEQIARLAGGRKVRATYQEDPLLLGGAIIRIGSSVYDGSVRAQLHQLKQRLIAADA
jgi:F-type H+-transporting ATPase subunit delta